MAQLRDVYDISYLKIGFKENNPSGEFYRRYLYRGIYSEVWTIDQDDILEIRVAVGDTGAGLAP